MAIWLAQTSMSEKLLERMAKDVDNREYG